MSITLERYTDEYGWQFTGGYPDRERADAALARVRAVDPRAKLRLRDDRTRKVLPDPEAERTPVTQGPSGAD